MRAFVFGLGYVGGAYARALMARGWEVSGTVRGEKSAEKAAAIGVTPVLSHVPAQMRDAVGGANAILITAPPGPQGCPGLDAVAYYLSQTGGFPGWIGYLSTTGVYGDREGGWVDERSALCAISPEGARRVAAERDWRQMGRGMGLTVTTFRLPGIYGPGRSALDRVAQGQGSRVIIAGHVFSRIHRDDIASALLASMDRPRPAGIYNICDDEPCAGYLVNEYAAELLGLPLPPVAERIPEKSERFYSENKRVSNALAKAELGWRPAYPNYRVGLAAILAAAGSLPSR